MRTTLDIDDDVLAAAKAMASQQRRSVGAIVSDLARRSPRRPATRHHRDGGPLLPVSNAKAVVTLDVVNALRDEAS